MKRALFGLVIGLAAAGAMIAAQTPADPARDPGASVAPSSSQSPSSSQARSSDQDKDSTLTGCLIQGSGPTVFILDNARMSGQPTTEKGKRYVLAAAASSVDFRSQLNHEVMITGMSDEKTMSSSPSSGSTAGQGAGAGQSSTPSQGAGAGRSSTYGQGAGQSSTMARATDEKDLPKLTAKSITKVADTCSVVGE
jgi:hypothetical protein